jgi:hypothetical protein
MTKPPFFQKKKKFFCRIATMEWERSSTEISRQPSHSRENLDKWDQPFVIGCADRFSPRLGWIMEWE